MRSQSQTRLKRLSMHACTYVTSKSLSWEHISNGFTLPGDSDGKCLPAMQETRVQSLGQENPLEKELTTHFSTLAWKIPWMEEPAGLQSMGSQRVGHN